MDISYALAVLSRQRQQELARAGQDFHRRRPAGSRRRQRRPDTRSAS